MVQPMSYLMVVSSTIKTPEVSFLGVFQKIHRRRFFNLDLDLPTFSQEIHVGR